MSAAGAARASAADAAAGAAPRRSRAAQSARKPPRRASTTSRLAHLVGYAASRAAIEMRKVFARHMEPLDLRSSSSRS